MPRKHARKSFRSKRSRGSRGSLKTPGTMVFKPFHPTPIYSHKFRYKIASAIVGQTVTQANIFACYVLATSAANSRSIIGNMRIKKVTAIATGLSATTIDELYIRDANQQGLVDPIDASSTGQGNAIATWKPNRKSLSADWFNFGTGGSLFTMSLPAGATLELDVDMVLGGAAGTISGGSYTGTYTTGYMYSMGLDGSAGSIYYQALGMNQA